MRKSKLTDQIERDTINLHRGRLICELLRREGILAHNSHIVMGLAESLLKSLARRSSR